MAKAKILIVDDNQFICKLIESRLKANDYQVKIALSGEEAFKVIFDDIPDLVLLDITMPGMDGFEFGRKLRSTLATRDVAIIMVTAQSQHSSVVKAMSELNAQGYVVKPFKPEDLLGEIQKVLMKNGQENEKQKPKEGKE